MALALQAGSNPRLRALRPRFRLLPDWSTPLLYAVAALAFGTAVPRLEHQWFPGLFNPITAPVAIAIDSSVASGMLALTGIVFALAFVTVYVLIKDGPDIFTLFDVPFVGGTGWTPAEDTSNAHVAVISRPPS